MLSTVVLPQPEWPMMQVNALHRQPQVLEHGGGAAAGRREALGDAFDRDELVGHFLRLTPGR
jgi:hypothetical protein